MLKYNAAYVDNVVTERGIDHLLIGLSGCQHIQRVDFTGNVHAALVDVSGFVRAARKLETLLLAV